MQPKATPLKQYLLLHSSQKENRYGAFAAEILRSEGLSGFENFDLSASGLPDFGVDDLAVLTRCMLTTAQSEQLHEAVRNGLRLVCFQPSWNLVKLLGWTPAKRVLHPGCVHVNDGFPGAQETLQTHLPIALYETETEYCCAATATDVDWKESGFPAVVRQKCGAGEIVFFFYDLPKTIARIRFGDPELGSLLTSGEWEWQHASDLFVGHTDDRACHLPQAELHAQLLAHLLTDICAYPLARLWYFEKAEHRAAANFSSDDDWSTPEQFQDLIGSLEEFGGQGTFYLVEDTLLSEEQVAAYRAQGHTFGPHVDGNNKDEAMNLIFLRQLESETRDFRARFGEVSLSLQCHCAPWSGYMDWLPAFVEHGYRLLQGYVSLLPWLNLFMCGAGRPIRFFDEDGTLFDCWQQPMHSYDDLSLVEKISDDLPSVVAGFEALLGPNLERFHSAIGLGSHPVSFSTYSKPFLRTCFALLQQEGVPIYNGDDWYLFTKRRDQARMEYCRADDGRLHLQVRSVRGALTLMLPGGARFSTNNDAPITALRRLECDYRFVPIDGDEEIVWESNSS